MDDPKDVALFTSLVEQHDLTHEYSDDNQVWQRGVRELETINRMKTKLSEEKAMRIWNANVDVKIAENARETWYWRKRGG